MKEKEFGSIGLLNHPERKMLNLSNATNDCPLVCSVLIKPGEVLEIIGGDFLDKGLRLEYIGKNHPNDKLFKSWTAEGNPDPKVVCRINLREEEFGAKS